MKNQSPKDINNEITVSTNNNFFIKNKTVLVLSIFGFLGFALYSMTQPIPDNIQHRNAQVYPRYILFAILLFLILRLFDRIKITKFNKIYKLFISKLIILIISSVISYYLTLFLGLIFWILSFGGNFRWGG